MPEAPGSAESPDRHAWLRALVAGQRVLLVEPDPELAAALAESAGAVAPGREVSVAGLDALDEGAFDVVVAPGLCEADDPVAVAAELARVVASGGLVVAGLGLAGDLAVVASSLEERASVLAEHGPELDRTRNALAEHDALRDQLLSAEAELAALPDLAAALGLERTTPVAALREALAESVAERKELRARADALEQRLATVEQSRSWRITRPLRAAFRKHRH